MFVIVSGSETKITGGTRLRVVTVSIFVGKDGSIHEGDRGRGGETLGVTKTEGQDTKRVM